MDWSDEEIDAFLSQIGERIKVARRNRSLTQDQLWDISGVPQGSISRLERGQYDDIMLKTLIRLAKGLEVSLEELIFGNTEDEASAELVAAVAL
ncbi:helix-turn-helix domain-containing protein [Candidatus Entotheonella palauensis]|uniref:helix-turn-helix domain-containing protein n=1 Tax=Candidatus Entotheonella palauensis TaxID=93172 RepID=UPI000B7E9515|nr:helix-turn-helix transcriptional regulator [Candidatus Entotheonella palauensis]